MIVSPEESCTVEPPDFCWPCELSQHRKSLCVHVDKPTLWHVGAVLSTHIRRHSNAVCDDKFLCIPVKMGMQVALP